MCGFTLFGILRGRFITHFLLNLTSVSGLTVTLEGLFVVTDKVVVTPSARFVTAARTVLPHEVRRYTADIIATKRGSNILTHTGAERSQVRIV